MKLLKKNFGEIFSFFLIVLFVFFLTSRITLFKSCKESNNTSKVIVFPAREYKADSLKTIADSSDINYYEKNKNIEIYIDTINIDSLYKFLRSIY